MNQLAEVLEVAAENAFTLGVIKGKSYDPQTGARCASAHLSLAVRQVLGLDENELTTAQMQNAMGMLYYNAAALVGGDPESPTTSVVHWNDSPKTTPAMVRERFLEVAKDLRNQV